MVGKLLLDTIRATGWPRSSPFASDGKVKRTSKYFHELIYATLSEQWLRRPTLVSIIVSTVKSAKQQLHNSLPIGSTRPRCCRLFIFNNLFQIIDTDTYIFNLESKAVACIYPVWVKDIPLDTDMGFDFLCACSGMQLTCVLLKMLEAHAWN